MLQGVYFYKRIRSQLLNCFIDLMKTALGFMKQNLFCLRSENVFQKVPKTKTYGQINLERVFIATKVVFLKDRAAAAAYFYLCKYLLIPIAQHSFFKQHFFISSCKNSFCSRALFYCTQSICGLAVQYGL